MEARRSARRKSTFFAADQVSPDDKPHFGKELEYWLVNIGYCVGFGNLYRFPYLVYQNGGAAFLIPYFLALFTLAIPVYMLEITWGQLIQCKLQNRMSVVSKRLWGISMAQLVI